MLKKESLKKKTSLRSLQRAKPLKSVNATKKPKKRLKLDEKSAQQLVKEADKWFSRYIRLRDSKFVEGRWMGNCVTCDRKLVVLSSGGWVASSQNGHFITRGCYQLRFDEFNCHLQCAHCNAWRDKEDMLERYRAAILNLYGEDTLKELKQRSKEEGSFKRPTKPELLQVIQDSKEYIKHAEEHAENYA